MEKFNLTNLMFEVIDLPEVVGDNFAGLGNLFDVGVDIEASEARPGSSAEDKEDDKDDDKEDDKDAELSDDSDDSKLLDSGTENKAAERSQSSFRDDNRSIPEDVYMEGLRPEPPKRTYDFLMIGKEKTGETIYRLSELYVRDDPQLKQRIMVHNKQHLMGF